MNRKLLKRCSIGLVVLYLIYVGFGFFGVPAIVKSKLPETISELTGRVSSLADASFNPFTLELSLSGLEVAGAEEASPVLARIGNLSANLQLSSAFLWRAELKKFAMSDVEIQVGLDESGALSFQDILDNLEKLSSEELSEPEDEGDPAKARIQNLDITNVKVVFEDSSLTNDYREALVIETLVGRNVGNVSRKIAADSVGEERYHWSFSIVGSLESGARYSVEGGALDVENWSIESTAKVEGFSYGSLNPYVAEFVEISVSGEESGTLTSIVSLRGDGIEARVNGGGFVSNFRIEDAAGPFAAFERFTVEEMSFRYPEMEMEIGTILLSQAEAWVERDEEGELRIPLVKSDERETEISTEESTDPILLSVVLNSFKITDGKVSLLDRSFSQPLEESIEAIEFEVSPMRLSLGNDVMDGLISASGRLLVLGGEAELSISSESIAEAGTVELGWTGLELSRAQPVVAEYLSAVVKEGVTEGRVIASINLENYELENAEFEAKTSGLRVNYSDTDAPVFQLSEGSILDGNYSPKGVVVKRARIVGPTIWVEKKEEGITVENLIKTTIETERAVGETLSQSTDEESELPLVRIDSVEISDGRFEFVDSDLPSRHQTSIDEFGLSVQNISTEAGSIAEFESNMLVDKASRISMKGGFLPSDPESSSSLELTVDGYDLVATTGYWERYLGRQLAKGQLEITSKYTIKDSKIDGSVGFSINQLTLGEKVKHEDAMNLPLGLAIGLLKGPNGKIEYDGLAISGDLSEPKVSVGGIVMKALMNLILKAATSPFQFLAGLGGNVENLDTVEFESGSVALDEVALEKALAIQKILVQRPELQVEVSSVFDTEGERAELENMMFAWILINRDSVPATVADLIEFKVDPSDYRAAVESAYLELSPAETDQSIAVESDSPAPAENDSTPKKKVSIPSRLLGLIGLGKQKSEPVNSSQDIAEQPVETVPVAADESEGDELPALDVMERVVRDSMPPTEISEDWLSDIERARIIAFKEAILGESDLDPSRIFQSSEESESASGSSYLKSKLAGIQ